MAKKVLYQVLRMWQEVRRMGRYRRNVKGEMMGFLVKIIPYLVEIIPYLAIVLGVAWLGASYSSDTQKEKL